MNDLARIEHDKAGRLVAQAQALVVDNEEMTPELNEQYDGLMADAEKHIDRRDKLEQSADLAAKFARDEELTSDMTGLAKTGEIDSRLVNAPKHEDALFSLLHGRDDHKDVQMLAYENDKRPSIVLRKRNWETWRTLRDQGMDAREAADYLTQANKEEDALSISTLTSGGNTRPTIIESSFFENLHSILGMRSYGATVFSTAGGEPHNYVHATDPTTSHTWDTDTVDALQTAEGVAATAREMGTQVKSLEPRKYTALTTYSSEILEDSAVNIASKVSMMLGRTIGNITELAYAQGRGGSTNEPEGVFRHEAISGTGAAFANQAAGLTTTLNARNTLTYPELLAAAYATDNYSTGNVRWLFKKPTIGRIVGILGSDGHPVFKYSPYYGGPAKLGGGAGMMGEVGMMFGYPVYPVTHCGNLNAANQYIGLLGPMSEYWIRDVDNVNIRVYDQTKGLEDQLDVVARLRTDGTIMNRPLFSWVREHA